MAIQKSNRNITETVLDDLKFSHSEKKLFKSIIRTIRSSKSTSQSDLQNELIIMIEEEFKDDIQKY